MGLRIEMWWEGGENYRTNRFIIDKLKDVMLHS
jgi:hypothetical protein